MTTRIEDASSLATMARLNPAGAARYADALLCELRMLVESCTLGNVGTSIDDTYEQIHSLKNAVAPTGNTSLISACDRMLSLGLRQAKHDEAADSFNSVATQALELIAGYRRELGGIRSSAAASSIRPTGL